MPTYAKFLKELISNKSKFKESSNIALTIEVSGLIQNKLPENLKIWILSLYPWELEIWCQKGIGRPRGECYPHAILHCKEAQLWVFLFK